MEVQQKITVQVWAEPIQPSRISQPVTSWAWRSPILFGVLGTLVFHVVLVAVFDVSFGRLISPTRPDEKRLGAGPSESLELLSLSAVPRTRDFRIDLRPTSKIIDSVPLLLKPPPSVNTKRLSLVDEAMAAGDPEFTQAAEVYNRQIISRIEGAWQKPPISSEKMAESASVELFSCDAQLEQDDRGNVEEVLLPDCAGSREWRESLLLAIREASPLPAPPNPRVFSSSLVLHFVEHPKSAVASAN